MTLASTAARAASPAAYYRDESVTLHHGDWRDLWPIEADVLVTDPPYGISYASGRTAGSRRPSPWAGVGIAGDESLAIRDELLAAWGERPGIVFGAWKMPRPERTVSVLVWDKRGVGNTTPVGFPWKNTHEEIYVLGPTSLWRHPSPAESVLRFHRNPRGVHPTEKPLGLMRALIDRCPPGVILDPFAGSGTTLRAAKDLGRRAVGVELDERYCEVAARRLAQEVLPFGGEAVE